MEVMLRKKKMRARYITLIEIMIVMFLIALITGILAYNYRGSLEEGKVFKTKAGIEKLRTLLELSVAQDPALEEDIDQNWKEVIRRSPLVQNAKDLEFDGWGKEYKVEVDDAGRIQVTSEGYDEYRHKKTH